MKLIQDLLLLIITRFFQIHLNTEIITFKMMIIVQIFKVE